MQAKENLLDVLRAIYKRRKSIVLLSILTAVVVAGFSLLLPNWYEGSSTFYVASPDLAKPSPIGVANTETEYYGEGEDIDRVLTIANSSQIATSMIEQFNLMDHYEIDTSSEKAIVKAMKKFNAHYDVIKTQYEALQMTFESTNPILARDVTNNARDKINDIAQNIIKDSQKKQLQTFESNIESKEQNVIELNYLLDSLRNKYEIYDAGQQGLVIAEMLSTSQARLDQAKAKVNAYKELGGRFRDSVSIYNATINGYQDQVKSLRKQASNFNKGVSVVMGLEKQASQASTQLALDKERYKSLKSIYNTDFDALHVVEYASKPVEKSRPKRSILVIASGALAFLLLSLLAIISEVYKKVDWKAITNE